MHIYILGISGTFMAGFAVIAKKLGWQVSGCDTNIYPPMSDQLERANIKCDIGFDAKNIKKMPDIFVIGNAISRGNPLLEWILNKNLPISSAPEMLGKNLLNKKHVIAISGTHGKTTTTAMVCHILNQCNLNPSFLIGGLANDFAFSAKLTNSDYFVIEADEYDTAFFDKRSKFMHYYPNTLVINNLEFDHADIFANYKAIELAFNRVIRTMPQNATIIYNDKANLKKLIKMECYSKTHSFGRAQNNNLQLLKSTTRGKNNQQILQITDHKTQAICKLPMLGKHNQQNALSAISAVISATDISLAKASDALANFSGVKRRQEPFLINSPFKFYEDFAHHPTAIRQTAQAMKSQVKKPAKLWLIIDPRSNSMKLGVHKTGLINALKFADKAIIYQHEKLNWQINNLPNNTIKLTTIKKITAHLKQNLQAGDCIITMSNGSFDGLKTELITAFS